MRIIDLRSDTVTLPNRKMKEVMLTADLGDDGYFEDPTICKLEKKAANIFEKDSGLFVASGTMANMVSLGALANHDDIVFVDSLSHIYRCEEGIPKYLHLKVVPIEGLHEKILANEALSLPNIGNNSVNKKILCLENTFAMKYGVPINSMQIERVCDFAKKHNLLVHIDGARIFNAIIALKQSPVDLAKRVNTLSFCLSKGLSCPYGAIVVGNKENISRARIVRNQLGGGLRQGGLMAATGIFALDHMIHRLNGDHRRARLLAEGLNSQGYKIDINLVKTNILFLYTKTDRYKDSLQSFLFEHGVRVIAKYNKMIRMVTHYEINDEDIKKVLYLTEIFLKNNRNHY